MRIITTCQEYQKKMKKLRNQFRRGTDASGGSTDYIEDWMLDTCWYLVCHMDYDSINLLGQNCLSALKEMEENDTKESLEKCRVD